MVKICQFLQLTAKFFGGFTAKSSPHWDPVRQMEPDGINRVILGYDSSWKGTSAAFTKIWTISTI